MTPITNQDAVSRLRAALPSRWFPAPGDDNATGVLDTILTGLAESWAWLSSALSFVTLQQRITSATGIFLDIAAYDYLGSRIQRAPGQSDTAFRTLVLAEILRPRVTRQALSDVLEAITGQTPDIFEFRRPADTGGMDLGGVGYDMGGGYGDMNLPHEALLTAYRPHGGGIAGVAGYDTSYGGYDGGRIMYGDNTLVTGEITDEDIRAAVLATIPVGATIWLRVMDARLPAPSLSA